MNISENSKVPYTVENIKKCMCPKCPVQASSKCSMDKLNNLVKVLENAGEGSVPEPQNVPALTAQRVKLHVMILIPKNNAYVTRALSGRSTTYKM